MPTSPKQKFDLYWAPVGGRIAVAVEARSPRAAIRKAPKPYRKYLGEIYAQPTEHKRHGSSTMPKESSLSFSTLYDALKAAGCETGNHESDLYVKATPEAEAILKAHGKTPGAWGCESFISNIDKTRWYDIPFAYKPWWEKRANAH